MRIYIFNASGDQLVAETNVVEEAEKILKEYVKKGCGVLTKDGADVMPLLETTMPDEAFILWPMQGG